MATPRSNALTTVTELHARGNRRSRDDWELYRRHRVRITETIAGLLGERAATLCLLGAGNVNDVDLEAVGEHVQAIHLVDIDAAALARAKERQPAELRPRLFTHGGVDLTGLLRHLDRWKTKAPDEAALAEAVDAGVAAITAGLPATLVGHADVAVSCCLLS